MSERTRKDYPRPKFEERVRELTAYKGTIQNIHHFDYSKVKAMEMLI